MKREEKKQEIRSEIIRIFQKEPSETKNGALRLNTDVINNDQFFDLGNVDCRKQVKRSGTGLSITFNY